MKRSVIATIIVLIFISACGFLNTPASPVAPPAITPFQSPVVPTAIPPTPTPSSPPASLGTIALDFVALLCDAQWMNGAQHLPACPSGSPNTSGGYAKIIDPTTEGLPADTPVILTYAGTYSAALFLRYPTFKVHPGDRFRATLRCSGPLNPQCDVQFALEYYDAQGKYHSPFMQWNYNPSMPDVRVDVDLSALSGQSVDFVLALRPQNGSSALNDGAVWIAPHIYRPNP